MCSDTYAHADTHGRRRTVTLVHVHIKKTQVQNHASVFTRTLHPVTKANARIGLKRAE